MKRREGNNEDGSSESMMLKKQRIQKHCIPPNLPYPWIITRLKDGTGDFIFSSTTPAYASHRTSALDLGDKKVRNCCHGWLILSNTNYDISLWNPVTSELIHLPPIESKPPRSSHHKIVLSSSPSKISTSTIGDDDHMDPNTMVFLFDKTHTSIIYCKLGEKLWHTVCYTEKIPAGLLLCDIKDGLDEPFTLNGSLYARGGRNHNELLCIHQVQPTHIDMRKYCDLPRIQGLTHTNHSNHLVESYGELFYIVVSSEGEVDVFTIVDMNVFKLNQESLRWQKMKRVQDRVFFLGRLYDISFLATREIKGGFIYHKQRNHIYVYSFEDHSISLCLRRLMWNIPKTCVQTVFFVPDLRLFDRQVEQDSDEAGRSEIEGRETIEQANKENSLFGMNKGESQLFGLPIDLLKVVVGLLNPVDYINLRSISKTCRSILPQIQWREPSISLPSAPLSPWLVFSYMDSGIHSFMDPKLGGRYLINIPKSLVDAKILHSKDGWLLMSKSFKALSFYNPLTKEVIKLPKLDLNFSSYSCIGFSSSPKSLECLVVVIDLFYVLRVYTIHPGEKKWHHYEFENHNCISDSSLDSPVFYDGAIYVLDEDGGLVVFELQREGQMTWKVLHIRKRPIELNYQNFLLVCAGKLLLVLISEVGEGAMVFKLNRAKMSWKRVWKLDNYALYVSRSSSFSTWVKGNGMENRIFLPRVHGNSVVNYSLKTGKFHCFSGQDDDVVKYSDTRNMLHASWIQPSW